MEMEWLLSGASDDPNSSSGQQLTKFIMKRVNHVAIRNQSDSIVERHSFLCLGGFARGCDCRSTFTCVRTA